MNKNYDEANYQQHSQDPATIRSDNILFTNTEAKSSDKEHIWLLIGAFSQTKKIAIFTDDPDLYRAGLFQSS